MATFSIGEAAKSGFRILGQHPRAVMMWSLSYFVIVLLPQIATLAAMWPLLMQASEDAAKAAGPEGPTAEQIEAALALQAPMALVQVVQFATVLLWSVLFYGAVYRAVLEPQNNARWYMRLGRQELWLGVVSAVGTVLFVLAMMVAAFAGAIVAGVFFAAGGQMSAAVWVFTGLLASAFVGALLWAGARLSVAYPMSFTERKFRLFEAWSLTRGHAGRIVLTMLAVIGLTLLIGLAALVGMAVLGLVAAFLAGAFEAVNPGGAAKFFENLPAYWPLLVIGVAALWAGFISVSTTVLGTIVAAPYAKIYQRLSAGAPLEA